MSPSFPFASMTCLIFDGEVEIDISDDELDRFMGTLVGDPMLLLLSMTIVSMCFTGLNEMISRGEE